MSYKFPAIETYRTNGLGLVIEVTESTTEFYRAICRDGVAVVEHVNPALANIYNPKGVDEIVRFGSWGREDYRKIAIARASVEAFWAARRLDSGSIDWFQSYSQCLTYHRPRTIALQLDAERVQRELNNQINDAQNDWKTFARETQIQGIAARYIRRVQQNLKSLEIGYTTETLSAHIVTYLNERPYTNIELTEIRRGDFADLKKWIDDVFDKVPNSGPDPKLCGRTEDGCAIFVTSGI